MKLRLSLLGRHGVGAREDARMLVRSGLAAIIGSDGHGGLRRHTLRDGYLQAVAA